MKRIFILLIVTAGLAVECPAQRAPSRHPATTLNDYSGWSRVEPENKAFVALFPAAPKYSKTPQKDFILYGLTLDRDPKEGITYEAFCLDYEFKPHVTAKDFLEIFLTEGHGQLIAEAPVKLNEYSGVEFVASFPNNRFSRLLGFVLGTRIYFIRFEAARQKDLRSPRIEYFLKNFELKP